MRIWIPVVLSLLLGCQFDEAVPYGARIPCAADRECPTDHQCDEALSLCLAASSPFTVTLPLQPARGRAGETFRLGLSAAGLVPSALAVVALDGRGELVGTFAFDDQAGTWSWTATGAEPEGRLRVFASAAAHSGVGTVNLVALGTLELDFTPPAASQTLMRVVASDDNLLVVNGFPALVTAGRPGAEVEVSFQLSEEVQGVPLVSLGQGDVNVPFSVTSSGLIFRAVATLPADIGTGALGARLEAADRVGNRATIELGSLQVLSDAPHPPSVSTLGAVRYHRAPWGTLESEAPSFRLTGAPGAASGAVAVLVVAGPFTIGRAAVAADGHFDAPLLLESDVPSVSVRALDAAGNATPLVEVLETEWTISALSAADAGVRRQTSALVPWRGSWQAAQPLPGTPWRAVGSFAVAQPDRAGTPFLVPSRVGLLGESPIWFEGRELVSSNFSNLNYTYYYNYNCPLPRTLRVDLERDKAYCFGRGATLRLGDGGTTFDDERFDGNEVWVPTVGRMLALGGVVRGSPSRGGFWYDGTEVVALEEPLPPARSLHSMAFDPVRERVLVFGGKGGDGGVLDDTWEWADGGFFAIPSLPRPPARAGASLAWEEGRAELVLAGGMLADGSLATDTWVHDGLSWRELDAGLYPPRVGGSLAQAEPGLLFLVGGQRHDGGAVEPGAFFRNGVWRNFTERPWTFRVAASLGYHPALGVVTVGGGSEESSCGDDCYYYLRVDDSPMQVWRDWGWSTLSDAGNPLTTGGRLAWDSTTSELVLSQGSVWADAGSQLDNSLVQVDWRQQYRWRLDGGWRVAPLPAGPDVTSPFVVFEEGRSSLLIHGGWSPDGGQSNSTWELAADGQWRFLDVGPSLDTWSSWQWEPSLGASPPWLLVGATGWRFDGQWSSAPAPAGLLTRHPLTGEPMVVASGNIWVLSGGVWVQTAIPNLQIQPQATYAPLERIQLEPSTGRLIVPASGIVLDFRAGQPALEFAPPLTQVVGHGDEVLAASVRARGVGYAAAEDGGTVAGLQLLYRLGGGLRPIPGSLCTSDGERVSCQASLVESRLLRSWLRRERGVQPDVSVGLTTRGPNGRQQAFLEADGFEFSVVLRHDGGAL